MNKKLFWTLAFLILVFGFILHLYSSRGYNFYFTVDQGDDAIHAREFFDRGQLLTKGPETGIQGVYSGPGWYYFISIGYKLFQGDPYGALVVVILLNLCASGVLMWWLARRVSFSAALLIGFALQVFWPFYDSSRWAFSPFPLVASGIFLVIALTEFWNTKKRYWWGVMPVLVALNAELAGAVALLVFYEVIGFVGFITKRLSLKQFLLSAGVLPGIGVAAGIWQFVQVYSRTHTIPFTQGTNVGTFAGTSFLETTRVFIENVRDATIPQSALLGGLLFLAVLVAFWKWGRANGYLKSFVWLTIILCGVSYLFFASNRGFQDWHDVYVPPLLFISILLMTLSLWHALKRYYKIGLVGVVGVILVSQLWLFGNRYAEYLRPSDDPGLLINQMKVLDWIYSHAEHNGFNAYTYVPTVEDDKYQYVFWWYGRKAYGYLPCEYSNFPRSLKYLYIPNSEYYSEPRLGCEQNVFLIVEPDLGKGDIYSWLEKASAGTVSLEQGAVGQMVIEKRRYLLKI